MKKVYVIVNWFGELCNFSLTNLPRQFTIYYWEFQPIVYAGEGMVSRAKFISIFKNAANAIIASKDELTAIDAKFGDADHGITMEKIAKAIGSAMDGGGNIKELLVNAASAVMKISGGSAVPLWNTFFEGLANSLDDQYGNEISESAFKQMFASGLDEMKSVTKANVGDKTMMDALIPAVQAIISCPMENIEDILKAGADAAQKGAAATSNFVSKFGRAKSYKEATLGSMDAGAVSMMYFFKGLSGNTE
jgi:dihydroxyacetone kinase-like protein